MISTEYNNDICFRFFDMTLLINVVTKLLTVIVDDGMMQLDEVCILMGDFQRISFLVRVVLIVLQLFVYVVW